MSKKQTKVDALIEGVAELAALYGKKGEGEQWLATLNRIEDLGKLAKAARKEVAKQEGEAK